MTAETSRPQEFWADRVKRLIAEAKTFTPPPELQQKFNARLKGLQYMNRSRHVPNGFEVLVMQAVMDTFEEMLANGGGRVMAKRKDPCEGCDNDGACHYESVEKDKGPDILPPCARRAMSERDTIAHRVATERKKRGKLERIVLDFWHTGRTSDIQPLAARLATAARIKARR